MDDLHARVEHALMRLMMALKYSVYAVEYESPRALRRSLRHHG